MTDREEEEIELVRNEMIKAGIQYGLENKVTIELSEKLDELMNKYGSTNKI